LDKIAIAVMTIDKKGGKMNENSFGETEVVSVKNGSCKFQKTVTLSFKFEKIQRLRFYLKNPSTKSILGKCVSL